MPKFGYIRWFLLDLQACTLCLWLQCGWVVNHVSNTSLKRGVILLETRPSWLERKRSTDLFFRILLWQVFAARSPVTTSRLMSGRDVSPTGPAPLHVRGSYSSSLREAICVLCVNFSLIVPVLSPASWLSVRCYVATIHRRLVLRRPRVVLRYRACRATC